MKITAGQKAALKTAVIYAVFGFLWIAFSDHIVSNLIQDRELLTFVNTLKGTLYVIVTAVLVFLLASSYVVNIEKAEEKYRTIFQNARDAIFVQDAESGLITDVNNCMLGMFNTEKQKVIGKHFDHFTVDGSKKTAEAVREAKENGTAVIEIAVKRADGQVFYVEADFIKVDYGGMKTVITVARDVTQRRKNGIIMESTMKELKRSNEDLEQFAMVSSHDLRQPLRNISNFSDLLQIKCRGKLDKEADGIIDAVKSGVKEMDLLITDILAFSRAGRFENGVESVDTGGLLEEVEKQMTAAYGPFRMLFDKRSMPLVMGDRAALKQVFVNIVSNGIKFNRSKNAEIKIIADDDGSGMWRFTLDDNGIGIDSQYLNKIFQIFERLHGQSEFPGTGVGLAICKKIVERHGGRIWAESTGEKGMGSRFIFTLSKNP
jgi:PAS domain S-box-containing protein